MTLTGDGAGRRCMSRMARTATRLNGFFKESGPSGCAGVETALMDFALACMRVAFVHADADIRIDHFHVAGLMVTALEQVRRAEHSKLARQGDDRLKGTRFDWLMTPQRMSPQRRRWLDEMLKQDLKVCEAWGLKEWVAEIWAYTTCTRIILPLFVPVNILPVPFANGYDFTDS